MINGDVMKDWLTTDEEGNVDLDRDKVRRMCSSSSTNMIPLAVPDSLKPLPGRLSLSAEEIMAADRT